MAMAMAQPMAMFCGLNILPALVPREFAAMSQVLSAPMEPAAAPPRES